MIPVVTPEEMAAIDAAAPEPVEVLIGRAGAATARAALRLLGGVYGRRVVVVAGKGNNGNDGRDAAVRLARRGLRVDVILAAEALSELPPADLVVDAAYGTGFRGEYQAPRPTANLRQQGPRTREPGPPVLAVDIPSGVDGLTGQASGSPLAATATVTFAAYKPGLLFHPGRELAGEVHLADIGLDVSSSTIGVVEPADVAGWLPQRPATAHKWNAALLVVAGSPGMTGAAHLVAAAAQRAGAGMVRHLATGSGSSQTSSMPIEIVGAPQTDPWTEALTSELEGGRIHALAIGPGLGTSEKTLEAVRQAVSGGPARGVPLLVDGDGLTALGAAAAELLSGRSSPAVLTPHDGEYSRLMGARPASDRCQAARDLASRTQAVVLLKGPTTVVAHPDGRVRVVTSGDQRLATAGTGDVLAGTIGALLAQDVDPFDAAAAGAWLHGAAASRGPAVGLVASDLLATLPAVIASRTT